MSLFRYKVLLADGTQKVSKITAKTKDAAMVRVAKLNQVKEWVSIKEEKAPVPVAPVAKIAAPTKPAPAAKPVSNKQSTQLEKLLFIQNGKCFFCGRMLSKAEASVEHLWPKSKGGTDADGNLVACCVTLNRTFGSIELKEKIRIILEKAGNFVCPKA